MKKIIVVLLCITLMLSLTACSSGGSDQQGEKTKIVVAGKNFTEQYLMAEIMGQLLKDKTEHDVVIKQGGYQTSIILNQGMMDGEIHAFVDYTGTGYINVLKNELKPDDTPDTVYQKTKQGYEEKFGITWLEPLGFNNTFALIMKEEKAKELNVETYSDLVEHSSDLVIGMDNVFYERHDGYKGLVDTYGFKFKDIKEMDIALAFQALSEGQIDVLVAYATDGRIPAINAKTLVDDKVFFPPYYAAPLVPVELLESHPEIGEVLNLLAGRIDDQKMSELNAKVDVENRNIAEVAREFLISEGLIND
ncbi:MAG: glycine betaine ABC transporter substrate-binding protein [Thermacetogeniaceae bacterium]|jgi:glycine betaine/choline ABC-type transport system substrate-binding protein|nr:glycine/betaine ABC transporter substrate-binding protein [Syntrophomonadaceae bacterium]